MSRMSPVNHNDTSMVYKLSDVTVVDDLLLPKYSNDVICCLPRDRPASECESHVVYFGGDMQDYEENMKTHRDNQRYSKWNLITTSLILQRKFPYSCIWIVKPSDMFLHTFAAYHNFVSCDDFGNPNHDQNGSGLHYLKLLLRVCMQKMATQLDEEFVLRNIEIVGFSKGCTVLNQFLYEIAREGQPMKDFVRRIVSIYWLDGGHAGGVETWITSDTILAKLKHYNIAVHVHTTPYQMDDPMRLFIGEEKRKFVALIRKSGRRVVDIMHFADEQRSVENHFKVLTTFSISVSMEGEIGVLAPVVPDHIPLIAIDQAVSPMTSHRSDV